MAIGLGTIFASVQISLATLQAQADEAKGIFAELQAQADAVSGSLSAAMATPAIAAADMQAGVDANTAALAENAAAADTDAASLAASGDAAAASSAGMDANTAATDANTASKDANTASTKGWAAASAELAKPFAIAALAVAAIGVVSVKMAGDFQEGMTTLVTGAGEAQSNIKMVGNGIETLAQQTGQTTNDLINSMFYVDSANIHGAASLQVLQTAAEGAAVGNANLTDTTNAVLTVMADYHLKADQSTEAMNGLTATVQNGRTNLEALATSMGKVLPTASGLHVSFAQVAGAMDVMTNSGMTARNAAQLLNTILVNMSSPSGVASKALTSVGLSAQDLKNALQYQGLPAALKLVTDAVGKTFPASSVEYSTAMKDILGGMAGLKVANAITGASFVDYTNNVKNITAAMKDGKNSVNGWSDVQGDFNTKVNQAKEAVQVFAIKLGTDLLPGLTDVATELLRFAVPAMNDLTDALDFIIAHMNVFGPILFVVAGAIAGPLVAAFWAWAVAAAAAAAGTLIAAAPVIAIGAAIAALALVIYEVVTHWSDLVNQFKTGASEMGTVAHDTMGLITGDLVDTTIKAQQATDKTKLVQVNNAIKTKEEVLAQYKQQQAQIIAELLSTTDPATRAALLTKLGVVDQAIDMQEKSVDQSVQMKAKITANMAQLAKDAAHHAELMKMGVWGHVIEMKEESIQVAGEMVPIIVGKMDDLKNAMIAEMGKLKDEFITDWQSLGRAVNTWMLSIVKDVGIQMNNFKQEFVAAWDSLPGDALHAMQGVLTTAHEQFFQIGTNFKNDWGAIYLWWLGIPRQMETIGHNIVQGLINGITGMIGGVGSAMGKIGSTIMGFLPHSPAKEGPLVDLPKVGPSLVGQVTTGMLAGLSHAKAVTAQLAGALDVGAALTAGGTPSLALSGAGLALPTGAISGGVTISGDINLTVAVESDANGSPSTQGEQFGVAAATSFTRALQQRGYARA